jgi:deoxyribose-phosphate aldolase
MVKNFNMYLESLNVSGNRVDLYALEENTPIKVRNLYKSIESNGYRAIATFADQMDWFEEFQCVKIALVNYPTDRSTQHRFMREIDTVLNQGIADEIEFPWLSQHLSWKQDKWRNVIMRCMEKGVILRPMLEIGTDTDLHLEQSIEYFKQIGITNVMTSTGLEPQYTTPERFDEVRMIFPPAFNLKVSGKIVDIQTMETYLKKGATTIATSVDILAIDII